MQKPENIANSENVNNNPEGKDEQQSPLHHINRFLEEYNFADNLNVLKEMLSNKVEKEELELPVREHTINAPLFTQAMKEEYTILVPQMLPIHFKLLQGIFRRQGYNVEFLENTSYAVTEQGLQNVHNDTCYPALLAIGQLLDAVKSGKYDLHKIALLLPQTGGGCRASNYIYLLRKALEKNGLDFIPVIAVRLDSLSGTGGFVITKGMLFKAVFACFYGDMILWLKNQCKPYEVVPGHTDKVVEILTNQLDQAFANGKYLFLGINYMKILNAFKKIELKKEKKPKVGIVGEIYMKYAPLGNNDLENYLISQGAQPVVTGVLDFMFYSLNNIFVDAKLYKSGKVNSFLPRLLFKILIHGQTVMSSIIRTHSDFMPTSSFYDVQKAAQGCINEGVKMGEGWLLTGEMIDLIENGVNNIVSAQPFGCLPNHIVAKGMIRAVKERQPNANIIAIDYDPGASRTNQENRIKLLLANANAALHGESAQHHVLHLDEDKDEEKMA
jgi:predicted nucleotide-binding protein (sugar kinase/HSP70/actin superfamily)